MITPYVPTPFSTVAAMLRLAQVTANDYVIDLGSGDGRIVICAAKMGARALGYEHDKRLIEISRRDAAKENVAHLASFRQCDLFEADISAASVVTIYLLPDVNIQVRDKLFATLKPGTRIVSHDYDMGLWVPAKKMILDTPIKRPEQTRNSRIYLWIRPEYERI